mgnify:CR=1 FL=1
MFHRPGRVGAAVANQIITGPPGPASAGRPAMVWRASPGAGRARCDADRQRVFCPGITDQGGDAP